jgi:hypothetical protein
MRKPPAVNPDTGLTLSQERRIERKARFASVSFKPPRSAIYQTMQLREKARRVRQIERGVLKV